jgi:LuxR family maltose regulon positive regulatory protein
LVTEAIQHALKVPDLDQAARLMEKAALTALISGEATTVQKWSAWIPEELAQQRPFLSVWFAMAFLISDKVEPAERYLSLVSQDHAIHSPPATELHGHIKAARSMLAYLKGDYENAILSADEALEQLPPEQTYLRGGAAFTSGVAHEKTGEEEAAFEAFEEARQISHVFGNRTAEVSALKKLGDLHLRRGQLHQADLAYRQALQLVSIREGQYLPIAGLTVSAMAQLLYEWDRLEEAEGYSLQGVELGRKMGSSYALLMNLQNLASIRWIHGDRKCAQLRQETEQICWDPPAAFH